MYKAPTHVLITGASSGLGAALAEAYAKPNAVLSLTARNQSRLDAVATLAAQKGAHVYTKTLDVADKDGLKEWMAARHEDVPLDLVIANAGISAGTGSGDETENQSEAIFRTNLTGVINTVHAAMDLMKKRGHGQIALMSSLAGFRGVFGAPSYCASKAAVRVYGEALRGELSSQGIAVNVICPGFVRTPMTDVNAFPMPFLVSAKKAAQIIKKGLAANRPRLEFPWQMAFMVHLFSLLPFDAMDRFMKKFPRKQGQS